MHVTPGPIGQLTDFVQRFLAAFLDRIDAQGEIIRLVILLDIGFKPQHLIKGDPHDVGGQRLITLEVELAGLILCQTVQRRINFHRHAGLTGRFFQRQTLGTGGFELGQLVEEIIGRLCAGCILTQLDQLVLEGRHIGFGGIGNLHDIPAETAFHGHDGAVRGGKYGVAQLRVGNLVGLNGILFEGRFQPGLGCDGSQAFTGLDPGGDGVALGLICDGYLGKAARSRRAQLAALHSVIVIGAQGFFVDFDIVGKIGDLETNQGDRTIFRCRENRTAGGVCHVRIIVDEFL